MDQTTHPSRRLACLGGLLSLLALMTASPLRADTIFRLDGKKIENIKIQEAGWEKVTYVTSGLTVNIDGEEVVDIDRASTNISPVIAALRDGEYTKALAAAEKAGKRSAGGWESARAAYLEGKIHYEWGGASHYATAIKSYKGYLSKYPKDFYVPHAIYEQGLAMLNSGKPKDAGAHFDKLARHGGVWKYKSSIGKAAALVELKTREDALAARRILDKIDSDRKAPDEVKDEASVIVAASYLVSEQYDLVYRTIKKRFLDSKSVNYTEHYARACNLLGDTYRLRGGKENLEQAELWYLRTTCFFGNYPGAIRIAAENLVKVYQELGQDGRVKEWQSRIEGL